MDGRARAGYDVALSPRYLAHPRRPTESSTLDLVVGPRRSTAAAAGKLGSHHAENGRCAGSRSSACPGPGAALRAEPLATSPPLVAPARPRSRATRRAAGPLVGGDHRDAQFRRLRAEQMDVAPLMVRPRARPETGTALTRAGRGRRRARVRGVATSSPTGVVGAGAWRTSAEARGPWMHVDGAGVQPAAPSVRHRSRRRAPTASSCDPHKWLFSPSTAARSCTDPAIARRAHTQHAG